MSVKPKPLGPIPQGFSVIDGELAIGGRTASELIASSQHTPLFVYSRDMLRARMDNLRAAMPERIRVNYAIKANSFEPVLSLMNELSDGLDIASGGELEMVKAIGADMANVSFAGPGKRNSEIEAAIAAGATLNLESEGEARRALDIADKLGKVPRLAIRVNPEFELRGSGMKMGGGAKPFGIDAERVPLLAKEIIAAGCEWRGLHIFTGSQALSAEAIAEAQCNVLSLAASLTEKMGAPLPKLNMGGGFGIPYFHGDEPVDIRHVGKQLDEHFSALPDELSGTEFFLELGRYLVGEAGVYLTRILDKKVSHGETYLVTDGGLHHQLAASGNFGTVIRRNYPAAIANRFDAEPSAIATIVGCLCTPLDRLADRAMLPEAEVGDLVAIFCAGAYGASASPSAFLGQGPAAEMLV